MALYVSTSASSSLRPKQCEESARLSRMGGHVGLEGLHVLFAEDLVQLAVKICVPLLYFPFVHNTRHIKKLLVRLSLRHDKRIRI